MTEFNPATSAPRPQWRDHFTREEIAQLVQTNNWRGWLSILLDWAMILGAMALVAISPLWLLAVTIPLAIVVIGGRQLGLAVLMHEAAHHALFKSRALNDWAGNWLCAYPVWADLRPYRPYHIQHHAKNWTKEDPDFDLANKFPVTAASMKRKIWRDLSGQVGWKRARAILRRDLAGIVGKTSRDGDEGKSTQAGRAGWKNLQGVVITNLVLLAVLAATGRPELYLLWAIAWFTTNSFVTRMRAVAEHNMVPDTTDELRNTRTTITRWWERLLFAPNNVNYHLEHHLLMTVPLYNLPRFHELLRERGLLDHALVVRGYPEVLRQAASKQAA